MARTPREDYAGAFHHITTRGNRKQKIFLEEENCMAFLGLVETVVDRLKLEVHAFALMPNHYHLLARSVHGNISQCMQMVNGVYALHVNRRMGWKGPLFQGRFDNQIVDDTDYLMTVVSYIHLNPVRAYLAKHPEEAHFTTYQNYTSPGTGFQWVTTDFVLDVFGSVEALVEHTEALRIGKLNWPDNFDRDTGWFDRATLRPSAPNRKTLTPQEVKEAVCAVTGLTWSQVKTKRRGCKGNTPRRLAIWALCHSTKLPLVEIGRLLNMSRSATSHAKASLSGTSGLNQLQDWIRAYNELIDPPP